MCYVLRWRICNFHITEKSNALETAFFWLCPRADNECLETVCEKQWLNVIQKLLTSSHKNLLLSLEGNGSQLEACQSSSINLLIFFRQRNSYLWGNTHKSLSNFFSPSGMVKRKAGKEFCFFIQPAWFIDWKCTICHLCLAPLLSRKKSVGSTSS